MIDLSDGLGADARHLAQASGVKLEIEAAAVPLAPARRCPERGDAGASPWWLLGGGEDYELLASIPPARLEQASEPRY